MKISLRLISFLLAALICLSLLPIGIMANEDTAAEDAQNETTEVIQEDTTEDTPEEIPVATPESSATTPVSGTDAEDSTTPTPTPTPAATASDTDASDYQTFTLSFDANGGNGAPDSITVPLDESITIPSTKPTRSNYTFQGWSCTKNGEVQYKAGTTYSSVASDLLYAVWGFKVKFNANGGTGAPSSKTKLYSQSFTIPTTTPTRSNYTFQGWSTTKNGTVQYKPGKTYTYLKSRTLYAVWGFKVKFDANGGTGAPSSKTKLYSQSFTIPTTTPTRSNYTFQGWSATKNGTVQYKPGKTYTYLKSRTLYAVWGFKVKFNANGGTGAPSSKTKLYSQAFTIPTTIPTKTGYTFQGWSSTKKGSVQYEVGNTYSYLKSRTLYAVWVKTDYVGTTSTGWHKYNGYWYYFDSNGIMLVGQWLKTGGYWYYLKSDGKMAASETLTISGTKYKFNSSGHWVS